VSEGGVVLGGMPRAIWGAFVAGVTTAALAIAASPAHATSDRVDYDAQVNPICAAANSQAEQVYAAFEQRFAQLKRKESKVRGKKKREKIESRLSSLFFDAGDQNVAVYAAEVARLKQVSAAPGDESLVSDWLAARQEVVDLSAESNTLQREEDRLFTRTYAGAHSLRKFLRLQKRLSVLDRQLNVLEAQLDPLYTKDIELGAKLGASYCVSSATGAI
jgi:ribosome-associated translation inhibitor RaiA